jgi:gliding motility-associated protein GldM
MGAKNCPETPRQKMINMMYIVLTAMLALNVSAEVLEAFRMVDSSLLHTMEGVEAKNRQVYTAFEQAYIENPVKVQEWKQKADNVRRQSAEMISYIDSLKEALVKYSGSDIINAENPYDPERSNLVTTSGDTLEIKKDDDLNGPSEYMITQKHANNLKEEIIAFKDNLVSNIEEDDTEFRETILSMLETPDPEKGIKDSDEQKTWESQYFENKPLIAVLTVLSKMEIDVTNAEANVINYLYSQIDAGSFKFNSLKARVIAKSGLVFQGEPYEAEVFLAAEDTTQQPQIIINGKEAEVVDGKAIYKVSTNATGVFKWSGVIKYKTPAGIINNYDFEEEYQVTAPSITMSATKMNVFYKGLENPFKVSGGGIPVEDLTVTMTNGTVTRQGNEWVVKPTDLDEQGNGKTKVSVYANMGGERRLVGSSDWRVKRVPDPVAQVAGIAGGEIRKEVMQIQDGVLAVLEDFDFDFKYTVTEFEMEAIDQAGYTVRRPSKSNRFTSEQKDLIQRANTQSWIHLVNIKARGDDGSIRDLDPVSFNIR